jgi:hypothetical protein
MPRLSELLDRFRPAGSPGASVATGGTIGGVRPSELDAILVELRRYEVEATAAIDEAGVQAASVQKAAQDRAGRIRAGLPEACAAAQADAETRRRQALQSSLGDTSTESEREIQRLRTSAPERIGFVVAEVLAGVRSSAEAPRASSVGHS